MSSLEQLYQEVILDHSRRRSGRGSVEGLIHTSHQVNPTCGDEVTLGVQVNEDGELTEVVWDGDGCSISQASLSMMCELIEEASTKDLIHMYDAMDTMMHSRGRGVDEEKLDILGDASALEGTSKFANRIKCSLLGWLALRDALAQAGVDIAPKQQGEENE